MSKISIHPTGTYPTDVDILNQTIINAQDGDTIVLKATTEAGLPCCWHFGDDTNPANPNLQRGSINVTKAEITIEGEQCNASPTLPHNQTPDAAFPLDRTVIYGGFSPIHCAYSNSTRTRLAVRNIYFAYPARGAVQVMKSAGLEVSDCVVYDAVSWPSSQFVNGVVVGIEATGIAAVKNGVTPDLTGDFKVFRNKIKRSEVPATYQKSDTGIVLQQTPMNADIHDNDVRNFALAGIGISTGAGGHVHVVNNKVTACGYGDATGGGFGQASGIGVLRTTVQPSDLLSITGNTVACERAAGTSLFPKNGIGLSGASGVSVEGNKIAGTVTSDGISVTTSVTPAGSMPSNGNRIVGNDLRNLVPGHDAILVGPGCSNNTVQGNQLPLQISIP